MPVVCRRKGPREESGKRDEMAIGRMVKGMAKAVRWGVVGGGASFSGDMGAPAEWLSGGVGYAGVKRWRKENRFLSRHCRTVAVAQRRGARKGLRGIRGVYGIVCWKGMAGMAECGIRGLRVWRGLGRSFPET